MADVTYPANLTEIGFLETYRESTLRKPSVVADVILRAAPFSVAEDVPILGGLLAEQVVEAALRLVAVYDALDDRRHAIARSLLRPLPGLGEWRAFRARVARSTADAILRDLSLGEDALKAAEQLAAQPSLAWLDDLIAASLAGDGMVITPGASSRSLLRQFWIHGTPPEADEPLTVVFQSGERDIAALADAAADFSEIARGLLASYIDARTSAGRPRAE